MTKTHPLALENVLYLEQGLKLLGELDEQLYRRTAPPLFTGSIGAHWRHCLDHYVSFLDGWQSGTIDYADRQREARLESDPAYACERAHSVIRRLRQLDKESGSRPLQVRVDCGSGNDEKKGLQRKTPRESGSSVDRELQFLVSHSVHHYALIALIMKLEGKLPAEDFGVAPSTLQYRLSQKRARNPSQAECAP